LLIMQYEPLFQDMVAGAAGLALGVAVLTIGIGVIPAIVLRERFKNIAES
ncbi:MAG: MFS transporter, partial [Planctomycetales bacterium]|nr:MFS transporter [Planctomycetales bacterium]